MPTKLCADVQPENAEYFARIEAALVTLPRFTRDVFYAHRISELSYAEIAQATETSVKRIQREVSLALFGLHSAVHGRPLGWWEWWIYRSLWRLRTMNRRQLL